MYDVQCALYWGDLVKKIQSEIIRDWCIKNVTSIFFRELTDFMSNKTKPWWCLSQKNVARFLNPLGF